MAPKTGSRKPQKPLCYSAAVCQIDQAEWLQCVTAYKLGVDDYPNLLGFTRYQKTRPILQLGEPRPLAIHFWNLLGTHVADLAEAKRPSPTWSQVVRNVLGEH